MSISFDSFKIYFICSQSRPNITVDTVFNVYQSSPGSLTLCQGFNETGPVCLSMVVTESFCFIKQRDAFSLLGALPAVVAEGAAHFDPGRPAHANTISTSIEASSHDAMAERQLFVLIIPALESHHGL